jgi:hypothetical protein
MHVGLLPRTTINADTVIPRLEKAIRENNFREKNACWRYLDENLEKVSFSPSRVIQTITKRRQASLEYDLKYGESGLVSHLLNTDSSVSTKVYGVDLSIGHIIAETCEKSTLEKFVKKRPDIRFDVMSDGKNITHCAILGNKVENLTYLNGEFPELIDARLNDGTSSLFCAAQAGSLPIFVFIDSLRPEMKDEVSVKGFNVFHIACSHGHQNIVDHIETHANDLTKVVVDGWITGIHLATAGNHFNLAKSLFEAHPMLVPNTKNSFEKLITLSQAFKEKELLTFWRGKKFRAPVKV